MRLKNSRWTMVMVGVIGLLMVGTMVGVALARPSLRPEAAKVNVLTVPPHACIGQQETTDYEFWDKALQCETPRCGFFCPVNFPHKGRVQVTRFTAYVFDNSSTDYVQVILYKLNPATKSPSAMAQVVSSDSGANPQVIVDNTIASNPVRPLHATYILVNFGQPALLVYGFRIHYILP